MHHLLTDMKLRHIGGDLFVEACMPPILSKTPLGPTFILFDMERRFAISLQEKMELFGNEYQVRGLLFSPIIFAETTSVHTPAPEKVLYMRHGEVKEMSLLIAYWFLRAKSGMGKKQVEQFLKTTYGDLAPVQWGNMAEPMEDMERFLRTLKVPVEV
ncbi:hypothetical protein [Burkholderia phage FLC9]|nr:hypothetical protein [Burkholderia phage FLC9]